MVAPLAFWWHCGPANTPSPKIDAATAAEAMTYLRWVVFGVKEGNVNPMDAFSGPTPMHIDSLIRAGTSGDTKGYPAHVTELLEEIAGELRHVWGFLIALGAGQHGVEASHTPQALPPTDRKMPNGKPLLPLVHKVLHLHLAKRTTTDKVIARAVTHHHNAEHKVRAHFRLLKKSGRRVPVKAHKRGDIRLGRVEKTYVVEK
jgi:hypothetical protein